MSGIERRTRQGVDDEVLAESLDGVGHLGRTRNVCEVGTGPKRSTRGQRRCPGVRPAADDQHGSVVALVGVWITAEPEQRAGSGAPCRRCRDADRGDGHRRVERRQAGFLVVKRHDAVGVDGDTVGVAGRVTGIGVDPRRNVDGDHGPVRSSRRTPGVDPFDGRPDGFSRSTVCPSTEQCVDDDVRRADREIGRVGDDVRRDLARLEHVPVFACHRRVDRRRATEEVDDDVAVGEVTCGDERVTAVVPPTAEEGDGVARV